MTLKLPENKEGKQKSPNAYPGGGGGGHINPARDIRDTLKVEDLEVYNMFTHGSHTLTSLRQSRHKYSMLKSLHKHKGFVAEACKEVGISRRTYYAYVADDPLFAEMVSEIREGIVDIAENMLIKNIETGFEASIIFYLKTQGRRRGYGEVNQIGAFQGTQEEFYRDKFKDLDDTRLLEEIASLRKRLKVPDGSSIGGFDEDLEDTEFLEESDVVDLEEIKVKDVVLDKEKVTLSTGLLEEGMVEFVDDGAQPEDRLDEILLEMGGLEPKDRAAENYTNKHIIKDKNDFRKLIEE